MGLFSWMGKLFSGKPATPAVATISERFEALRKMLPVIGIPNFNSALLQDSGMFQFGITTTDDATKEQLNLGFLLSIHLNSLQLRCYGLAKLPPGASPTALLREMNRINCESLVKVVWNEKDGDVEIHIDLLLAGLMPTQDQLGMCMAGPFAILQRERANLVNACAGGGSGGGGGNVDSL